MMLIYTEDVIIHTNYTKFVTINTTDVIIHTKDGFDVVLTVTATAACRRSV
jgi:hypothetical protein